MGVMRGFVFAAPLSLIMWAGILNLLGLLYR